MTPPLEGKVADDVGFQLRRLLEYREISGLNEQEQERFWQLCEPERELASP